MPDATSPQPVTGFGMPVLGLGTLGNKGDDGTALVAAGLAAGYRHVDTAEFYGNEDAVGRGIAQSPVARDAIWLTTKILHPRAPRPASIRAAAQASLSRLGVDYVDALLIHWPNQHFELEESLEEFVRLRTEGKARHIGVSNFPSALLRRALDLVPDLVLNQVEYHPFLNQDAVLAQARAAGVVVVAHAPLARGRVLDAPLIAEVAQETNRTSAQVALRWLVQQNGVAAVPGGSPLRLDDLTENLGCLEFSLSDEQMARIAGLADGTRVVDGPHAPAWDPQ